jgi:hypothetical protein
MHVARNNINAIKEKASPGMIIKPIMILELSVICFVDFTYL